MTEPLYIESAVAISAQDSFWPERFLEVPRGTDRGWLSAVDAPYQDYVNPVAIRRMSRMLKVSISAAMEALRRSGIASPDAIITGTGRGVITDMEQFVMDLDRLKEATLNPTLFIQSTYNSANGWIAMQSRCRGYNQTYVHRGISFELALQDTAMLLAEQPESGCVLCGGFDEMTTDHYRIRGKLGAWRRPAPDSLRLYDAVADGSIAGEGAAFFMLCRERTKATVRICDLKILYEPDGGSVQESCQEMLERGGYTWKDVSLVVSGYNGDGRQLPMYDPVHQAAAAGGGHILYKHLCGEYDTATGFGLWLGNHILSENRIFSDIIHSGSLPENLHIALIVNINEKDTASITLIERAAALTDE